MFFNTTTTTKTTKTTTTSTTTKTNTAVATGRRPPRALHAFVPSIAITTTSLASSSSSPSSSSFLSNSSHLALTSCFNSRPISVPQRTRPSLVRMSAQSASPSPSSYSPTPKQLNSNDEHNNKNKKQRKLALPGIIFLCITYIWAIILIIPMLIAHPFILLFDRASRRFHDVIAMAWMRCSCGTVGVRPQVVNKEKIPPIGKPVVYVANHASYLDIFVFAYLFRRIKYVSKAEIFRIPIVGWAMQMAGNIALVRASSRGQMQAYRQMVSTIRNGLSLVVFPEGTRSVNGIMRRFKPGAFRAAKQNNVDIVPITILGTREAMPSSAYVPLNYPTRHSPIQIVIHDAIDTQQFEIPELCERAFRAIDSALPEDVRTWDGDKRRTINKNDNVNSQNNNNIQVDSEDDNSGI